MKKKTKKNKKHCPAKLPRDIKRTLEYWKQSIADGRRMSISGRDIDQHGLAVSSKQVAKGICDKETAQALFDKAQELARDRPRHLQAENDQHLSGRNLDSLQILIAPLRLSRLNRSRAVDPLAPRSIEPLWVPAMLSRSGELALRGNIAPWIPRIFLEPLPRDSSLVLGELSDVEDYMRKNPLSQDSTWGSYWSYCASFFRHCLGSKLSDFSLDGYQKLEESMIIIDRSTSSGTTHIERLYQEILDGRRQVGLAGNLANLSNLRPSKRRLLKWTKGSIARTSTKHCGQFAYSFSLSPSQRRALHQSIELPPNQILSVSGPPGTGKTTLIQSIVASMWVLAARSKDARPPLIVVCSATNQAVTNVIDTFAKAGTRQGPLGGRWLPEVNSYGTFCSSETKSREVTEIPLELLNRDGFFASLENRDYQQRAERCFLEHFAKFAYKTRSIRKAVRHLQRELRKEFALLYQDIYLAKDGNFLEWLKRLFGLLPGKELHELTSKLEDLDTSRRHRAFQLATHYWEGRFLLQLDHRLSKGKHPNPKRRTIRTKADWQYRAMLTPCFVSTFYMAPRFFGFGVSDSEPLIDLLIAEEAGQVSPEIGAASFSLAKGGIVIGDTEQLEPVWSLTEYADRGNLTRCKLLKRDDHKRLKMLERSGILASSGSLMKNAISACPLEDENSIGSFLSEHRRSVPEIVQFANTLSYRNRLQAKRPHLKERVLPAFGYADIRGVCVYQGKSRLNKPEAEAIRNWLKAKRGMLEKHYQAPLGEIIAILTPFTAQTRYLKQLLRGQYPQMTIGTVNALQGAERPVVLFSAVYNQSKHGRFIFDLKPNMLNVSVTRAKDTFLVFGDIRVFERGDARPSSILGEFLLARPEHDLLENEANG